MKAIILNQKTHPAINFVHFPKEISLAFDKMNKSEQFGNIIINMDKFSSDTST